MSDRFFEFARERMAIWHRRQEGELRPWTTDTVMDKFRFTNVYRELDATTVWFAENVREPMTNRPEVLLATVLFRWFNRITTGEAIFTKTDPDGMPATAWENLLIDYRKEFTSMFILRHAVTHYCGNGPYVTGAYIIKTPDGYTKLEGVLWCVEQFMLQEHLLSDKKNEGLVNWEAAANWMPEGRVSLEQAWNWLRKFPYLGDFMAYEIVTDLRHTALLDSAPDIMTWANPGPGAMRGLNRIHLRHKDHRQPKHVFVCEMRELLEAASASSVWPENPLGLPVEMRDIEHTLCEFDKYERARLGEGRPRGVYR